MVFDFNMLSNYGLGDMSCFSSNSCREFKEWNLQPDDKDTV